MVSKLLFNKMLLQSTILPYKLITIQSTSDNRLEYHFEGIIKQIVLSLHFGEYLEISVIFYNESKEYIDEILLSAMLLKNESSELLNTVQIIKNFIQNKLTRNHYLYSYVLQNKYSIAFISDEKDEWMGEFTPNPTLPYDKKTLFLKT